MILRLNYFLITTTSLWHENILGNYQVRIRCNGYRCGRREGAHHVSSLDKSGPWQSELEHSFLPLGFMEVGFLTQCCATWDPFAKTWHNRRIHSLTSHGVFDRSFPQTPSRSNTSELVHLGSRGAKPREYACQAHDFHCGSGPGSVWSVTLCRHWILRSCCCWSQDSLQQNTGFQERPK